MAMTSRCLLVVCSALLAPACGNVEGSAEDPDAAAVDAAPPDAGVDANPAAPDADPGPDLPSFGVPEPLVMVHVSPHKHLSPRLVAGGTRLYYIAMARNYTDDWYGDVYVSTKLSDGSFGAGVAVPGAWGDREFHSMSISEDELEIMVTSHGDQTFRAVRQSADRPFDTLGAISTPAGAGWPAIAGDELFFARRENGSFLNYRATRNGRGAPFSEGQPVTVDGRHLDSGNTSLSPDGRTLYYSRQGDAATIFLFRATRSSRDTATFTGEESLRELNVDARETAAPAVGSDEIVFQSNRVWSPAFIGLWRAKLCRGPECTSSRVNNCEETNQRTSPDGRHCYTYHADAVTWEAARTACRNAGGKLATIHSAAEHALISDVVTGAYAWTGANDRDRECNLRIPGCSFVWDGGEPFTFERWGPTNPDDANNSEDCVALDSGAQDQLNDSPCTATIGYVCETEVGL